MNQSDPQSFIDSLSSKFNNIVNEFDTLKINVESSQWTETVSILKNDFDLTYFSWLSAIAVSYTHLTLPTILLV